MLSSFCCRLLHLHRSNQQHQSTEEKSHKLEEAPISPGPSHRVTSEPLKEISTLSQWVKPSEGKPHSADQHLLAAGNVVVCITCFRRNFSDLAYQYRQDIPASELPVEASNRPDCYWGRHCRTQKNKSAHARNYNHICEQTRMA